MTYAVAWVALAAGFAFALWPVLRHRTPPAPREERAGGPGGLLDEIDLDEASGRLSSEEAAERRREAVAGGGTA